MPASNEIPGQALIFPVCLAMLSLMKVNFIQGAFKNIQGLRWKIQGLFKDIPKLSNFQGLFKARANHASYCKTKAPKNGLTAWFDPQMKKLEPHCIVKQTVPQYSNV